ncbi:auxin-responsive protein SAUR72 [Cornus florida]|uniref:auxin-responsive protein SAUR72 n=1 Tax=Cornus florida TaxID=4283 RepID=UPI00289E9975|nr:auxin-responsive protein SAUR72 [Cornus florida]
MDSKKSNKISEIVRLQRILKKWRKLANTPKTSRKDSNNSNNSNKSVKFLKKTLSFSDNNSILGFSRDSVPKGFLAVCVGGELKRFVIPMEYLSHTAFDVLLKEAEEEFGFQQEGVLRIPCQVPVFEKILKLVEEKGTFFMQETAGCCSSESQLTQPRQPQSPMCR